MTLLHLLAAYGLCFGLMNDKFPSVWRLRRFTWVERMLNCSYCTGFHCGWLVWLVSPSTGLIGGILFASASAAFCYAFDTWVRWHERSDPGS